MFYCSYDDVEDSGSVVGFVDASSPINIPLVSPVIEGLRSTSPTEA